MINYQEAQRIILIHAVSFGEERISLDDADGRILAENIYADRDYPPFNRSAMDGYAIQISDWKKGIRDFNIQETIFAGQKYKNDLSAGSCYKIMTGAAVPAAANAVIRREDTQQNNDQVKLTIETVKLFQNIARQGEDLKKEQTILEGPQFCTPAVISLLASVGRNSIVVKKLPSVALFTTGDEIVPVDATVTDVQIRNSNYYLLRSLLKKWNIVPAVYQHIPDDINELTSVLGSSLKADMIIMCGGVSAGDADYVPEALEKSGVVKLFHKVSIKPGKPIWCGKIPDKGLVFALPGNPFSCLVNFKIFIESFLSVSFGLSRPQPGKLPFNGFRPKKIDLDEFFPVCISGDPPHLEPVNINGSGDIRLGLHANALALHPAGASDLTKGTEINYYKLL